jgi:hypothetical protein
MVFSKFLSSLFQVFYAYFEELKKMVKKIKKFTRVSEIQKYRDAGLKSIAQLGLVLYTDPSKSDTGSGCVCENFSFSCSVNSCKAGASQHGANTAGAGGGLRARRGRQIRRPCY